MEEYSTLKYWYDAYTEASKDLTRKDTDYYREKAHEYKEKLDKLKTQNPQPPEA